MERNIRVERNIQKLVKLAVIDLELRNLLKKDIKAAYKDIYNEDLDDKYIVKFIEKTERVEDNCDSYYILPDYLKPTWLG